MSNPIRLCPRCHQSRPLHELYCEAQLDNDHACGWSLLHVPIRYPEQDAVTAVDEVTETIEATEAIEAIQLPSQRQCNNGHPVADDDFMCLECGADIVETPLVETPAPHPPIADWQIESPIENAHSEQRYFSVRHQDNGTQGLLILYPEGHETDPAIYHILQKTAIEHIPQLLETGHWQQQFYEVHEWIKGGNLTEQDYFPAEHIEHVIEELGTALHDLGTMGIRHRTINPRAILVRSQDPLDLVVTDFSSARLSDFDLETIAPLSLSRYSAPETIVGAVSVASDWWGLGIILLEQLTQGDCFKQINDKVFMMHVVTRHIDIPENLTPRLQHLLSGLLARDPLQRWQWAEVKLWLDGNPPPAPQRDTHEQRATDSIQLNEHRIRSPEQFALLAAQHENWEAGNELFIQGYLATWCEKNLADKTIAAQLRQLRSDHALFSEEADSHSHNSNNPHNLNQDFKYSLVLMILNPSIPLTYHGDIITPAWLLPNAALSYRLLNSRVIDYLQQMERERWLISLKYRMKAIRKRGKLLDIAIDEAKFQLTLLTTSRAKLEAEYALLREIYPDASEAGLIDLLDKVRLNDDDLILLLSADSAAFIPLAETLQEATDLAQQHDILTFDADTARQQLVQLRIDLYQQLNAISVDFARCGHAILDGWLDDFRLEARLKLARILVLLSIPAEQWQKPKKQKYLNNLFHFFEKRVINNILRGSLVRLTISKNTAKIDLTELETGLRSSSSLLEHVLDRGNSSIAIDPKAYRDHYVLSRRLANTVHQARIYRQETGIDSLYIGFPFLLRQESHKTTLPRIAPLLLWPVAVDYEATHYNIRFAKEREAVRLNPALEGLLPSHDFEKLKKIRQDLLRRGTISIQTVLDNFGSLYPLRERQLVSHPKIDLRLAGGDSFIEASAVLFNATFVGQAISEDLRRLRQLPIQGTALESAFQLHSEETAETENTNDNENHTTNTPNTHDAETTTISQRDRYFITHADPSQEKAILHSRTAPGLLIEGPPGTGKSQTIVNIISDCVGRKENILVICQKQAALQVVAKRLEARGLKNRFFIVNDINRDRQSTIRTLREQLVDLKKADANYQRFTETQHHDLANKIDRIEKRLNAYHHCLYQLDSLSERSFRHILSELIVLEEQHPDLLDVPTLRALLDEISPDELNTLQEMIKPLAHYWLLAQVENNPLQVLKRFATDKALTDSLTQMIEHFAKQEHQRADTLATVSADFDDGEQSTHKQWLKHYGDLFLHLDNTDRQQIAAWFERFDDEVNTHSAGADSLHELEALQQQLATQNDRLHDAQLYRVLQQSTLKHVKQWHRASQFLQQPRGWFWFINPAHHWHHATFNKFQQLHDAYFDENRLPAIEQACELELACRPIRQQIIRICEQLHYPQELVKQPLKQLRQTLKKLIDKLQRSHEISQAVLNSPRKKEARAFILKASEQAYQGFFNKVTAAITRASVREKSLACLADLSTWFSEAWLQQTTQQINENRTDIDAINALISAMPTAQAYQHFRLAAHDKPERLFAIFKHFRVQETALHEIEAAHLGSLLSHTLRRETLLGWKNRLEREHPALLISKQEINDKITELEFASNDFRESTQQVLHHNINPQRLGNAKQWEAITRLRGVRYKRLREFIDEGMDIGLMEVRPVWLMNPEVVSQALPLKANLFDVVIYDEASQLMVDYAIPSLYRARRAIVSGDEKQMPPTRFFASRINSDEDPFLLDMDDDLSASEKVQQEEAWNRHEIKDQGDLLSLGRSFLPSTTLQIHYRSRYESLITFSNHAFYSGQLNVPSKHPVNEIARAKPLEVIQVNGEYTQQTNPAEAARVVEIIARYWQQAVTERPSIGVVTFNKKQAELIEEHIQTYADENKAFNEAYLAEIQRVHEGEETGFFVKNVENVQGDERDIMLFSTTFGRDAQGRFYRRFGALGQVGGERRLNVAITRAKEKVILVTSMPLHEISDALATGNPPDKPRDYLQLYLDFANKISQGEINSATLSVRKLSQYRAAINEQATQDGFVRTVADYLQTQGYPTTPATDSNDSFQLDLAIEHPQTGLFALGIECDSPQHYLLAPASAREIWRPSVLRQSVGQIHRINSRDWYHDNEQEKACLLAAVESALVLDEQVG